MEALEMSYFGRTAVDGMPNQSGTVVRNGFAKVGEQCRAENTRSCCKKEQLETTSPRW